MNNQEPTLDLNQLRKNLNQLLAAVINAGHDEMEIGDIGDLIGRTLITGAADEDQLKEVVRSFGFGVEHGIGLSHGDVANQEKLNEVIGQWENRKTRHAVATPSKQVLDKEKRLLELTKLYRIPF